MAHLRLAPLDFASASLLEALLRARMCLQLGHFSSLCKGSAAAKPCAIGPLRQGLPRPWEAPFSIQEAPSRGHRGEFLQISLVKGCRQGVSALRMSDNSVQWK